jgi:hypothetical protein
MKGWRGRQKNTPTGIHLLIPGPGNMFPDSNENFAAVIKLRILRWGDE